MDFQTIITLRNIITNHMSRQSHQKKKGLWGSEIWFSLNP